MKKIFYSVILWILVGCSPETNNTDTTSTQQMLEDTDWKGYSEAYRVCLKGVDTSRFQSGSGCGSFILFKEIEKGVLTIESNLDSLKLAAGWNDFVIGKNIEVVLEVYYSDDLHPDSIRAINYCSCVRFSNTQKRYKIKALKGNVTLAIAPGQKKGQLPVVLARLTNLQFYDPIRKENVFIKEEIFWDVSIGWLAG